MNKLPNVAIIFTDASTRKGVSAWGGVIELDSGEKIALSGSCPKWITSSTLAEKFAIYKCVEYVRKIYSKVSIISLFSDCQGAVQSVKFHCKDIHKAASAVIEDFEASSPRELNNYLTAQIRAITYDENIRFFPQYVEGHQLKVSKKAKLNDLADRLAREQRWNIEKRTQNRENYRKMARSYDEAFKNYRKVPLN